MDRLPEREVIRLRYGLGRVRQIEADALERLSLERELQVLHVRAA